MHTPFIGREALDANRLTRHELRSRFVIAYPGIYIAANTAMTAGVRAEAAWLWARRRAVVAGSSAAALHGAKWLDPRAPAELIYANRHSPRGIETWADAIADDEIAMVNGIRVTSVARTALDLARRHALDHAVAGIDALLRATRVKLVDVEVLAVRYRGHKGSRRARAALALLDAGAESPRETALRLLIVGAGYPRPETQIRVIDQFNQVIARVDMGWADLKIAIEYDGDHHWTDRRQLAYDIKRTELLRELGWIVIRVTAEDTDATILRRIELARAERGV
ncbi:MAG TPA: DUF559 domain-containing protein [Ilumatobacteraceae bacterium]